MARSRSGMSDLAVELFLGKFLQMGVLLAGAVVLFGGIAYLSKNGGAAADGRVFRGEPATLRLPGETLQAALKGESAAIIQIGVLLLIAVPVLRVALSALAFGVQRDWTYVLITLFVLGVLLGSIIGGNLL